jgi:hypothetical protein
MQWFTRAWIRAELPDEEAKRRLVSYQEHYRRILPTLDEQVAALAAIDLHDGLFFRWSLDLERGEITLRILAGDLQRGYQFVHLAFRTATLVGPSPTELERLLPDSEILYEEIDQTDTGYEYRLILAPEGEFAIRFEDLTVSIEPATPADREAWFAAHK